MSHPSDVNLRQMSRHAFGQAHRLSIMLTFMESPGPLCLNDLSSALGVTASSLQTPLANLVALGLVAPTDGDGTRRRLYVRVDGPAWTWARDLASRAQADT